MTEDTPKAGHNSAGMGVKQYIAQIVQTEREKKALAAEITEFYASAKDAGINVAALRRAVKLDMLPPTKREDLKKVEDTADEYLLAAGVLD